MIPSMDELMRVGPDSLRRFLTRWYGPPDRPRQPQPDTDGLPAPLREWFELTREWSSPPGLFVAPSPSELTRMPFGWGGDEDEDDEPSTPDGDVLIFWPLLYDGFGRSGFGVAVDGPADPPVLYGGLHDDAFDDWHPTGYPLSTFLVYAMVLDILGGEFGRELSRSTFAVTPEQHQLVVDRLVLLEDPLWTWENDQGPAEFGNRYWCDPAGDVLALTQYYGPDERRSTGILGPEFDEPEYDDAYLITMAARHPAALEPFDQLGVPWSP